MNVLTAEWIEKAEADLTVARLTLSTRNEALAFTICFHSQQSAEKYLKAYLTERRIEFRRIHDVAELLALVLPSEANFETIRDDLNLVSEYAVDVRYPGRNATWDEAESSVEAAERVRAFVRTKLGLADARPQMGTE